MTTEKFTSEAHLLKQFFELHCHDKHQNQSTYHKELTYNNEKLTLELKLCKECKELIEYSFDRLSECPHDPKPRCRKCPNSCYEKPQWKKVAKLMRYSGIKLGFIKLKNAIFRQ